MHKKKGEMMKKVSKNLYVSIINFVIGFSTHVAKSITYTGIIYYEQKEKEDTMRFAAAKNLNALLEVCLFIFGASMSESLNGV